jgi:hypothetical protein
MKQRHSAGSIVTLICDSGDRYADTIYQDAWRQRQGLDLSPWSQAFDRFERTGQFDADLPDTAKSATKAAPDLVYAGCYDI